MVLFFAYEGYQTGFKDNFLKFGPTEDENGNSASILGIKLDNWENVVLAYIIIFLSTILQTYYSYAVEHSLFKYLSNPLIKNINYSKFWAYLLSFLDPLMHILLHIVTFFATATFQLQYILPQLLGIYLASLPFIYKKLNSKKFLKL